MQSEHGTGLAGYREQRRVHFWDNGARPMAFIHLFIQNIGGIETKYANRWTAILHLRLPCQLNKTLSLAFRGSSFAPRIVPGHLHNMSNEKKRDRRSGRQWKRMTVCAGKFKVRNWERNGSYEKMTDWEKEDFIKGQFKFWMKCFFSKKWKLMDIYILQCF